MSRFSPDPTQEIVMFRLKTGLAILLAAAPLQLALADLKPDNGKASFGYLGTTGNAENTSYNGSAELNWERDRWTHRLEAAALGSDDDGVQTSEAYQLGWKSNWAITERSYAFGKLRWQKDKFSGYDQQITETIGYGRKLIDTEVHAWSAEVGAGARQSDLRDGTSENEAILRLATEYDWNFSETGTFEANLAIESGPENTLTESVLAVSGRLLENLSLVVSYTVRNNSDVPAGSEKTDTFTAVSIEYSW
jgi:putative salt-induced outer membrane protein